MGYCLACGKNRETVGGLCEQCRVDRAVASRVAKPSHGNKAKGNGKPPHR